MGLENEVHVEIGDSLQIQMLYLEFLEVKLLLVLEELLLWFMTWLLKISMKDTAIEELEDEEKTDAI